MSFYIVNFTSFPQIIERCNSIYEAKESMTNIVTNWIKEEVGGKKAKESFIDSVGTIDKCEPGYYAIKSEGDLCITIYHRKIISGVLFYGKETNIVGKYYITEYSGNKKIIVKKLEKEANAFNLTGVKNEDLLAELKEKLKNRKII